jgi:AcrR family transcriptional regulator
MGRPKLINDSEVLDIAFNVISNEGFESFTFAQVGKAVGLSPAALVKRFKTKKHLALLARNQRWENNFQKMTVSDLNNLSGIEGIYDFLHLIARSVDSKKLGEHIRWLGIEADDLKSKKKVAAYFEMTRNVFVRLLAEAVRKGELSKEIDPNAFAFTLEALVQGAIFQFAFLNERNIKNHLEKHFSTVLKPFIL